MTEAQRRRFLAILAEESGRLSDVAQALAAYFDRIGTDPAAAATPEEALDRFLAAAGHVFPALDALPPEPGPEREETIRGLCEHPELDTRAARDLARRHLARYAEDAALLPPGATARAGSELRWDPLALSQRFGVPIFAVFRRLATLRRPGIAAPPFAGLEITAAGHVAMRRPLPGIPLPRHGTLCPVWPVFEALARPGQPVARPCRMPDGTDLVAFAWAEPLAPPRFGEPPRYGAALLVTGAGEARSAGIPLPPGPPLPVGPGCRICTRTGCDARTGESILG